MKKYLDKGIKEVLEEFPQLAPILMEYDINCYQCNGNCLLKSIFEEHNLSMKEEMEAIAKISKVLSHQGAAGHE